MRPIVALVGRPNVGKSTLFNRLVGWRKAIVSPQPGLTRDRLYGVTEWEGREMTVVDTAGLEADGTAGPEGQTRVAIAEANVIVFLLDARDGVTAVDLDVVRLLRRSSTPVVVVANKADDVRRPYFTHEIVELGLDEPVRMSGQHGVGVDDMLDRVVGLLPPAEVEAEAEDAIARIAIMGRPNVGKSSLLNRLLGDERAVVSEVPGTTRDPVDTEMMFDGLPLVLVDTAGIRRNTGARDRPEHYSLLRAIKAMERADVVLLVIEAHQGVLRQDQHVASYALEAGKGLVVAVNKVDLAEPDETSARHWTEVIARELKFAPPVPVVTCSALTGRGVQRVLPVALEVAGQRQIRMPTGELNRYLREQFVAHPPPSFKGKRLKLKYATQAATHAPTVVLFVNDTGLLHFGYRRYLENRLRERWPFTGNPIKLVLRAEEDAKRR